MTTLIGAGSSPSGLGLVLVPSQHEGDWDFRLTTPCCEALFVNQGRTYVNFRKRYESISAFCEKCKVNYTDYMFECGSTLYYNNPATGPGSSSKGAAESWIARALGYPDDGSFKITVE